MFVQLMVCYGASLSSITLAIIIRGMWQIHPGSQGAMDGKVQWIER